jgi:hypothetical protein
MITGRIFVISPSTPLCLKAAGSPHYMFAADIRVLEASAELIKSGAMGAS